LLSDSQGQRLLSSSHRILATSFLCTKQGGLHEYFHSHSSAPFISLKRKPCQQLLAPRTSLFLSSSSNQRAASTLFSSRDWSFDSALFADLPLPTKLPLFFPSSARLHGSESPARGQVWKSCRWVLCPISSLTLEEDSSSYQSDW
jgi:hypothetical protein